MVIKFNLNELLKFLLLNSNIKMEIIIIKMIGNKNKIINLWEFTMALRFFLFPIYEIRREVNFSRREVKIIRRDLKKFEDK